MITTARSRIELIESRLIPLAAVWVNGSFVTTREQPSDLDAVVIINGTELSSMWRSGEMDAVEAVNRVQRCMAERYEPGGTARDHLTDFQYAHWYPEGHGFYHDSVGELASWSTYWSRVRVWTGGHTGPGAPYVDYDDSKGYAEVRWSS